VIGADGDALRQEGEGDLGVVEHLEVAEVGERRLDEVEEDGGVVSGVG